MPRVLNLGWCFLPSKIGSDTTFLSYPLTNFEEIVYTSDYTIDLKSTKKCSKSVHRRPRNKVSDTTFEVKNHQPKFKIRTLSIGHTFQALFCILKALLFPLHFVPPQSCAVGHGKSSFSRGEIGLSSVSFTFIAPSRTALRD